MRNEEIIEASSFRPPTLMTRIMYPQSRQRSAGGFDSSIQTDELLAQRHLASQLVEGILLEHDSVLGDGPRPTLDAACLQNDAVVV